MRSAMATKNPDPDSLNNPLPSGNLGDPPKSEPAQVNFPNVPPLENPSHPGPGAHDHHQPDQDEINQSLQDQVSRMESMLNALLSHQQINDDNARHVHFSSSGDTDNSSSPPIFTNRPSTGSSNMYARQVPHTPQATTPHPSRPQGPTSQSRQQAPTTNPPKKGTHIVSDQTQQAQPVCKPSMMEWLAGEVQDRALV